MRNLLLFVLLVLLIFLTRYCKSCCSVWGNCQTVNTNELCVDPLYKDSIYCHQIITQGPQSPDFKAKLDSLGFVKTDSCDCDADFALWISASHTVVELVSVPPKEGSGGRVGGVGGDIFCVNIPLEFTPRLINRDQLRQNDTTKLSNPSNASANVVKIAVVDSGVDTTNTSIKQFLWRDKSPLNSGCGSYPQVSPYGINMVDKTQAPLDLNNHGTQLNSILINFSKLYPEFDWQNEAYFGNNVRLEIMNVKFTEGSTLNGSLFKAICGMYYAIKKGAKVINVSWGFYADDVPVILKPVLQMAQDSNVLIVAGVGNRKSDIDKPRAFWPAAFARDTMSYWNDATKKIKNVISVGGYKVNAAHNFVDISDTTNYGANSVNVFALGQDVLTILAHPSGQTALGDGTSFATPFVTRSAALLRGIKPSKSPADIKQCIINATKPLGATVGPIKGHNHSAVLLCN